MLQPLGQKASFEESFLEMKKILKREGSSKR
jgi:hypothetical protein